MINPNKSNPKARTGKDIFNLIKAKQQAPAEVKIPRPIGDVQEALVVLWNKVLTASNFDTNDDFFKSGGNSIKAVQLASQVAKHFGVPIELTDIFLNTSITSQAVLIQQKQQQASINTPIQPQERPELIPLSFSQERLWFIEKLEGSIQYHIPLVFSFKGELNIEALEASLKEIVERHEVLRTVIKEEDGKPFQCINSVNDWQLERQTIPDSSEIESNAAINQLVNKPFNLAGDYMLRATLIAEGGNDHLLVLVIHHIASDGWSMSIMAGELIQLYQQHSGVNVVLLPALPLQYADYALWQKKHISQQQQANKLLFWKDTMEGLNPLSFPTDFARPVTQSTRGALLEFTLPTQLAAAIAALSNQQGVTLFNTLLAAFNVLLYRYTNQADVCVGTVVANRPVEDLENLIGFFTNTLPIRNEVKGTESFTDFVQRVKATTLRAFANQDVPVEKIIDTVVTERDLSRHPLFNIVFVLQNTPDIPALEIGDLRLSQIPYHQNTTKFDITFNLKETANGIEGEVEYCIDLFTPPTIHRFVQHYILLLESIVKEPATAIAGLNILGEDERYKLITAFNDNRFDFAEGQTMVSLFEKQAAKNPTATALVFQDGQLTYGQLNTKANQLAHYLQTKGVQSQTLVPFCMDRCTDMIVSILGILKAGGAYVPIDPAYPQERIRYMLDDTGAALILTKTKNKQVIPANDNLTVIDLDENNREIQLKPEENIGCKLTGSSLAYIIYTSGSTGRPKGVMIEHGSVVNEALYQVKEFGINASEKILQFSNIAFDASVEQYMLAFTSGATLVLIDKAVISDQQQLFSLLKKEAITHLHATPSFLEVLPAQKYGSLKRVIAGGEQCSLALAANWSKHVAFYNEYGPTETTITITECRFSNDLPASVMPIGKPLANSQVYILDTHGNVVPIGVAGEIYIGGAQVGRGYLNMPDLTAEKFISDPFSNKAGARLYKTGDLGRWMADGNLEYLGRMDDQVKIRGYRIELGEIESAVLQSKLVKQVLVIAGDKAKGLQQQLVAYVVPGEHYNKQSLLDYIRKYLPDFMVPAIWIELDALPLNANGKVDKKALPDYQPDKLSARKYVAPETPLQKAIAETWQDLLGVHQIGIEDNFFEKGGDSILTIQVVSRLKRLGYSIQPKDIFLHQTINKLAHAIINRIKEEDKAEQDTLNGPAGLLPVQQSWLSEAQPVPSYFNQSVMVSIDKKVPVEWIQTITHSLVNHHDALRFRYSENGGQWIQEYGDFRGSVEVEVVENNTQNFEAAIQQVSLKYQAQLSIEKGEIIKVVFINTLESEVTNKVLIIIHHLAVDGISWRILLEDFERGLATLSGGNSLDLQRKTYSYRQWFTALVQYGSTARLLHQKAFWKKLVDNIQPLQTDFIYNQNVLVKETQTVTVSLNQDYTDRLLKQDPLAYRIEVTEILIGALYLTLSKWYKSNSITIWLEGHGRETFQHSVDVSSTVGWFTTMFPLLLQSDNDDLAEVLDGIKEHVRQIPDKGIGYGILKYLIKEEALQGSHPVDLLFNYLGQLDNILPTGQWLQVDENSLKAESAPNNFFKQKISIGAFVSKGKLQVNWLFSTRHFHAETIQLLSGQFVNNLVALLDFYAKKPATHFIPSDFFLSDVVSPGELDSFLEKPYNNGYISDYISDVYKLSGLQQGMLFHTIYEPASGAYINQFFANLTNPNTEVLSKAWQHLIAEHSILRSAFFNNDFNIPVQGVFRQVVLPVNEVDVSNLNAEQQKNYLNNFVESDRTAGFDIEVPPLMRLSLFRLNQTTFKMVWTSHHILFDGWSLHILFYKFLQAYEKLSSGRQLSIINEDPFSDYIHYLDNRDASPEEDYWRSYVKGVEDGTTLPVNQVAKKHNEKVLEYKKHVLPISPSISASLQKFAREHKITINTIFQATWAYLLHTYTHNQTVFFGVTVSGRPPEFANVESRVGMYINTVPLKSVIDDDTVIAVWLQNIQQEQAYAQQFQYTPIQNIQEWSGVRSGLFDTLLVFENYPFNKQIQSEQWSLHISDVEMDERTNYPLTIGVTNYDQLLVSFNYNSNVLCEEYIQNIGRHFQRVLEQIIDSHSVKDIKILSAAEEHHLLVDFNNTDIRFPQFKNLAEAFNYQVERQPGAIAVMFDNTGVTYQQLNEKANRIAHFLKQQGIGLQTLVPICVGRGVDMIAGLLGILKAGAAYIPIDPDYPQERINFVLKDSDATHVLCNNNTISKFALLPGLQALNIDEYSAEIKRQPANELNLNILSHHLAYIIYTSGSTGLPKGVMVEHGGVVNLAYSQATPLWLQPGTRTLQFASYSFDASCYEIFNTLLSGGQLVIPQKEDLSSPQAFNGFISKHKVQVAVLPPTFLQLVADYTATLQTIVSAGEALNPLTYLQLKAKGIRFINAYGPTETTVCATLTDHPITAENIITIGKPVSNVKIRILNDKGQLVPVNVSGEICVAGVQVARGYLNRPDINEKKFVKDPFGGGRMYKTGDVGRWLPDGNIEYLGRIDDQVKIRGLRIEPGEIENTLLQYKGITQAIVLTKQLNNDKVLVAYYVPSNVVDSSTLKNFLSEKLPAFMVPEFIMGIDQVPVTISGKVDKKLLPAPRIEDGSGGYSAPVTVLQKQLAGLWHSILGYEKISIDTDFFSVGGNSISAMRFVSALRKELNIELPIKELFLHPSIQELATIIETSQSKNLLPAILAKERPEFIPLAFSQARLWFIHQLQGTQSYHLPAALQLKGTLNIDALEKAIRSVIDRHEVLRTVYKENDGKPYQLINTASNWKLERINDVSLLHKTNLDKYIAKRVEKPFDLTADYMLRADIIILNSEDNILVINMHHIAADGWSIRLFIEDLIASYQQYVAEKHVLLSPLTIQFADYAIWQNEYFSKEVMKARLQFWIDRLQQVTSLQLPADYPRPAIQSLRGANLQYTIEGTLVEKIRVMGSDQETTLFITLLAAFNVLLYRYGGQQDICVGTSVANRQLIEVEDLIGFFVNNIALRSTIDGADTFINFLHQVKHTVIDAYDYQDVPFERVVDAVVTERDTSRNPLFQVMFVLQNTPELPQVNLAGLQIVPYEIEQKYSQLDLIVNVKEAAGSLHFSVDYCTDLFARDTIQRMMDNFKMLLQSIAEGSHQHIDSLQVLSKPEQQNLLVDFNATSIETDNDVTVVDLFRQQVLKNPSAVAIKYKDQVLTYKQLDQQSDRVAIELLVNGTRPGDNIPLCISRCTNMMVAIWGILKAGGVFVPVDPGYPAERKAFLFSDTNAALVICDHASQATLTDVGNIHVLNIDAVDLETAHVADVGFSSLALPSDPAYIIYTSGSTGKPKGVVIQHASLVHYLVNSQTNYIDPSGNNTGSYIHLSFTFDASITALFMPLLAGKAVVISATEGVNVFEDENFLANAPYDFLKITPAHLELLKGINLYSTNEWITNKLVIGGEALYPGQFNYFYNEDIEVEVINEYGPTEATVGCIVFNFKTVRDHHKIRNGI
ncbi:MAG: amino acid adenylation domain-containing protein, partial [Chitinophagaceae bacterium]|nr:amino acid adenylation domain-containing protein [Chitinophagaceae bacterium]